jgi:SAM-dependent methyltransferase
MTATTNPNKALWEKGDFTQIAASMRESGEALVSKLGITEGLQVLDLGCGDGTTAVPAAQLGADVLGVDIASNLVAAGKARAKELGLANLSFQEGDATDLNELDDESFDLVISVFGAMFAPKAFRRRQGDGQGDQAWRPDRDGELDPERPDAGGPDPEDQLLLRAPAPGGLRQSDDLGCRGRRDRALHEGRSLQGADFDRAGHLHVQLPGSAVGAGDQFQELLRADHERVRGRGGGWPRG